MLILATVHIIVFRRRTCCPYVQLQSTLQRRERYNHNELHKCL